MTELLRNLDVLHACGVAVAELEGQLESIPVDIAEIESKLEQFREASSKARASLEEAEQERRGKEGQLLDLESQREKFQSQSALVKTNTEYTALLNEIESATTRIAQTEDEILSAMERIETESAAVVLAEQEQREAETELGKQIDARKREFSEAEADLAHRREEREVLVERLPPPARSIYDRVLTRFPNPVTKVVRRSCGSCHFDVPFETINRVKQGDLHSCLHCARILVPEEV